MMVFDQREVNMKEIKIHRISYSPGYGDMLGEYHGSTLKQDKDGNRTFVCSDRNVHNEPTEYNVVRGLIYAENAFKYLGK